VIEVVGLVLTRVPLLSQLQFPIKKWSETCTTTLILLISGSFGTSWGGGRFVNFYPNTQYCVHKPPVICSYLVHSVHSQCLRKQSNFNKHRSALCGHAPHNQNINANTDKQLTTHTEDGVAKRSSSLLSLESSSGNSGGGCTSLSIITIIMTLYYFLLPNPNNLHLSLR